MKKILLLLLGSSLFVSCTSTKLISKKNEFFKFIRTPSNTYEVVKFVSKDAFKAEIKDKGDYLEIMPKLSSKTFDTIDIFQVTQEDADKYFSLVNIYYPETMKGSFNANRFTYYDIKFGLQAMTIPLKFRGSVGNDTLNPPTVEAAFNIGFAPGWKFAQNIWKPDLNYLGKHATQFSLAVGPLIGIGSTSLKKATNAPDVLSDHAAPILTGGIFLLCGFNNINIGVSLGQDYVPKNDEKGWVYQGKTWVGIMVGLDVLKF